MSCLCLYIQDVGMAIVDAMMAADRLQTIDAEPVAPGIIRMKGNRGASSGGSSSTEY